MVRASEMTVSNDSRVRRETFHHVCINIIKDKIYNKAAIKTGQDDFYCLRE